MMPGWLDIPGLPQLEAYLISLAIGLLMGAERERRPNPTAGLRTFALIALLAATLSLVGQRTGVAWLPAVGLVLTGAAMIAVTLHDHNGDDPGTTTIVAALLCYALASLVWVGEPQLAMASAIGATVLMYFKSELRGVMLRFERDELVSILQFAVLSVVILPLLPDRDLGPYGALNPRLIWLMVVLISGVSLAGWLALRVVGPRHGTWVLGLLGGLVSSTATTLAYARHGRGSADSSRIAAPVIVIANLVILARLALLVAVVSHDLMASVGPILGVGFVLGAIAVATLWHRLGAGDSPPVPAVRNPTSLRESLLFGAMYGAVLLAAAWLRDQAGASGLYAVAVVSGLTDVDAITLSSLRLHQLGQASEVMVRGAIVAALLANTAFKLALTLFVGDSRLALRCAWPMGVAAAGLLVGMALA